MRALRILSLPCSTGEEPYSIAMALLDAGLKPHQFKVDGMDVSPLSVEKARRALYGKNSFRGQDIAFRDRHFSAEGEGYRLSDRVLEQVRLQVGNLLDPALLASEPPYDFVFCRNLLIYFDQPTQRQVFEVLKRLTHVDGVLFIGPAEGGLLGRFGMRSIGIAQSFAFSRQSLPEPEPFPAFVPPPLPARQPARSRATACRAHSPFRQRCVRIADPTRRKPRTPPRCWRTLPCWPMKAKVLKPAPRAKAICVATNRSPKCFIGWDCSAMSAATPSKPKVFIARRCTLIRNTPKH